MTGTFQEVAMLAARILALKHPEIDKVLAGFSVK